MTPAWLAVTPAQFETNFESRGSSSYLTYLQLGCSKCNLSNSASRVWSLLGAYTHASEGERATYGDPDPGDPGLGQRRNDE